MSCCRQDFVSQLVAAARRYPEAGAFCGKLLRWDAATGGSQSEIIDSTGMYFTRNMRHLDRGAEEPDHGQYDRVQYVFGATGAAVMFRREFIEAVSVDGEFFDEEFFSFAKTPTLAWRAQLMGQKFSTRRTLSPGMFAALRQSVAESAARLSTGTR